MDVQQQAHRAHRGAKPKRPDDGNRRPYFAAAEWGGTRVLRAVAQYFVSNSSSTITSTMRKRSSDRERESRHSLRLQAKLELTAR